MFKTMNIDNAKSQMRKGMLEYCILLLLKERPAYASDIIQQLKEAELLVVEGTLYPLLTRLQNDGLLGYEYDLRDLSPGKRVKLKEQVETYKRWRDVLQWGDFYRICGGNDREWCCVSPDKSRAVVFTYARRTPPCWPRAPMPPTRWAARAYPPIR